MVTKVWSPDFSCQVSSGSGLPIFPRVIAIRDRCRRGDSYKVSVRFTFNRRRVGIWLSDHELFAVPSDIFGVGDGADECSGVRLVVEGEQFPFLGVSELDDPAAVE